MTDTAKENNNDVWRWSFCKNFPEKKMESKSKKKLKFLDKEKSEELIENILQAKDRHTEDFKLKFCDTYRKKSFV